MPASLLQEIGNPEATIAPSGGWATEEALVTTAKGGNPQAFETLVERYRQKTLAIALRYTRVQEDAEDVVQQAFQKAFIHLNEFEGKSSFSTWLTRIAINEALMLMRRFRALRQVSLEDSSSHEGGASGLEIPDASPNHETKILTAAMGQLRPSLRTAIELPRYA